MKTKYTKEQLQEAIAKSKSKSEVIKNLGLNVNNGNYESIRFWALQWGLELPVWNPSDSTQEAIKRNTVSDNEWFQKDTRREGANSKKRLYRSGVKEECVECGLGPEWNSKPITLQLDHIDGDKFNNTKENLQILCPNCHTQTKTYANNGAKKRYHYCIDCKGRVQKGATRCRQCESKARVGITKVDYPALDVIVSMIEKTSFSRAGKDIGCTDNALRKHLERNGVDWKSIKSGRYKNKGP